MKSAWEETWFFCLRALRVMENPHLLRGTAPSYSGNIHRIPRLPMATLELRFLGEFGVLRDGEALPLPPSKKTRALLAYLCMHPRRLRREHLCELLWEIPDDPKGSLRWSLSKLRRLIDDEGRERIVADRGHVEVDLAGLDVDAQALVALAEGDLASQSTDALEDAVARYAGAFLEGLEFSDFHDFHAWCVAERERVVRAQALLRRELVQRWATTPERGLPHARALVSLQPYDEAARASLIRLLVAAHQVEEADHQVQLGLRLLKEAGIPSTGLLRAARQASPDTESPASPAEPPPHGPSKVSASPQGERVSLGRSEERRALAAAWAAARGGQAGVVLLRGEPGLGKSHLLDDLAARVRSEGGAVISARTLETDALRPFSLWLDALRATGDPAGAAIFGEAAAASREQLFARLGAWLGGQCAQGAVALLFDDVHWCDESSFAALHDTLRAHRNQPVLAVLAARESEMRDNPALQQALRGLRRDGLLSEIRLGPLAEEALAAILAQRMAGTDAARLARECGGNPLLALELARAELAGGGESGGSLDELVRERLARFDSEGAEVLRWAAVLGGGLSVAALQALARRDAAAIEGALEEGERQAILVSSERGLGFTHDLIARAIYTDIAPVRRQIMHRKVANWLEQDPGYELSRAAALAHHASLSGDPGLAARAMVSAGRLCLRFFANDDAQALVRRGLEWAEALPEAEQVRVVIELNDVLLAAAPLENWRGAADAFTLLAERALDHGAPDHARQAYQMAAYVRWQHGQWAGAREQALQSERVARSGSEKELVAGLAETAKCLVMLERDLSQADAMAMEAQALAQRGEFTHRAIPAALGMLRFYENRLDEAEDFLKRARTLCKWAGDRINEYQANEYLAMIDIQCGRYPEAQARCQELIALGAKIREGSEAPFAHALMGLCNFGMTDDPGALDAALVTLREVDAKHRLAYAQTRAAMLDCRRGRHDSGAERAREALACAEVLERNTEMLLAHAVLAQCCRADGHDAEADPHVDAVARLHAAGVAAWADDIARHVAGREGSRHG